MKKSLIILIVIVLPAIILAQNIAITDDDAYTANNSAMLDVKSLTKGLLVPRLTTAQRTAIVTPATGLLVFDTTINGFYYYNGSSWINLSSGSSGGLFWSYTSPNIYMTTTTDYLGLGTSSPLHKLHIYQSVTTTDGTNGVFADIQNYSTTTGVMSGIRFGTGTTGTPDNFKGGIFFQRNGTYNRGDLIFANNTTASTTDVTSADGRLILQKDGRIMIKGDPNSGVNTSIFAVQNSDGDTIFAVYPEGVRVWVNDDGLSKASGNRGGFAVGGFSPSKAGFTNEYLRVTPDSVRVYIEEGTTGSKASGNRGGFAVGGFSPAKANTEYYFNIEYDTTEIIVPSEPRMLWYPNKEAFLSGRVLVESIDSVGTNSMATGYESKSIGNYSQAFGFHARAKGNNSTAIGNYANAETDNSFAFGDSAQAKGISSYAIGSNSIASGDYSTSFGFDTESSGAYATSFGKGTTASGQYSFAAGYNSVASGYNSYSLGLSCNATATSSVAMGYASDALGSYSYAMGYDAYCYGTNGVALGYQSYCSGNNGVAMGNDSRVDGSDGVAMGNNAEAYIDGVALGRNTNAYWGSFAVGLAADASGAQAISIGQGSIASGSFSKTIGDIETSGSYSFGIALDGSQSATNITQANTMAIMGGNVGINKTNPNSRLHIVTDEASNWIARFWNDGATTTRYGIRIQAGTDDAAGTNYMVHCYDGDGTLHGGLAIVNATVSVVQNSDKNLKENIIATEYNGIDILKGLQVVDYNYISCPGFTHVGYLAQDAQKIFPAMVIEYPESGIYGMDMTRLIPIMNKAIQEQQNIIDDQEKRISGLEYQNEQLKAEMGKIKELLNTSNKK
ncbi:MAG: tail fiber domain-containing protein [Bacteroidota bacterium]